jgi:predicted deacetylase
MEAKARLDAVVEKLKAKGVRDIKPMITPTFTVTPDNFHVVLNDVAMILEQIEQDNCTPAKPFGDSYGLRPRPTGCGSLFDVLV